jgi:hypothetical protein
MFGPLTPPSRLAPRGEVGNEVCAHRVLWGIGLDPRLAFQGNDIVVDEGARTLPFEGQGEALAIRGF